MFRLKEYQPRCLDELAEFFRQTNGLRAGKVTFREEANNACLGESALPSPPFLYLHGPKISFLSPKGWDTIAQGRAKRRPGCQAPQEHERRKGGVLSRPVRAKRADPMYPGRRCTRPGLSYQSPSGSGPALNSGPLLSVPLIREPCATGRVGIL